MNVVGIDGRVVKEPETITTNSGTTILKFAIANNDESRKNEAGEYEDVPSFFDVTFFVKSPQYWLQKIRKGSYISFAGRLKQERWEQDGNIRSKVVLIVQGLPSVFNKDEHQQPDSNAPDTKDDIPF